MLFHTNCLIILFALITVKDDWPNQFDRQKNRIFYLTDPPGSPASFICLINVCAAIKPLSAEYGDVYCGVTPIHWMLQWQDIDVKHVKEYSCPFIQKENCIGDHLQYILEREICSYCTENGLSFRDYFSFQCSNFLLL